MKKPLIIGSWAALALVLGWVLWQPPRDHIYAAASYNPHNGDPCALNLRVSVPINLIASGQVITGVTGKYTYICHLAIVSATAQNVALVEGTGAICASGTAGMAGGATAATGWNFGATNQSIVEGNGSAWAIATASTGTNVCLLLSGTGQTSGVIQFVQQ
jgi:hypothetical protein